MLQSSIALELAFHGRCVHVCVRDRAKERVCV